MLKRQFDVLESNKVGVTDITYIRTYEGWLYLAVVLDLFSRRAFGWSMKLQMTSVLAIDALVAVGGENRSMPPRLDALPTGLLNVSPR